MASLDIRPFSGVILAGGAARRMGRDKALIEVAGESLLARQTRVLREAGATEVFVVQHPKRARSSDCLPLNVRVLWDPAEALDAGPLAGLVAGLAGATCEWVAVAAVDLPDLTPRWWRQLLEQCRPGIGAVGRAEGGFYEPLAAIYPREAYRMAAARLSAGDLALQTLIEVGVEAGWLQVHLMNTDDRRELRNWNSGVLAAGRNSP